jgi:hypothetical protein
VQDERSGKRTGEQPGISFHLGAEYSSTSSGLTQREK